jgi:hypothetical protein
MRSGFGAGMAHFIALVSHKGEIPADFADRPAPDPATFGLPTEDDGTRNEPLLGQNIIAGSHYELDFDAIRALRPASCSPPGPSPRARWPIAVPMRWPTGWGSPR